MTIRETCGRCTVQSASESRQPCTWSDWRARAERRARIVRAGNSELETGPRFNAFAVGFVGGYRHSYQHRLPRPAVTAARSKSALQNFVARPLRPVSVFQSIFRYQRTLDTFTVSDQERTHHGHN